MIEAKEFPNRTKKTMRMPNAQKYIISDLAAAVCEELKQGSTENLCVVTKKAPKLENN